MKRLFRWGTTKPQSVLRHAVLCVGISGCALPPPAIDTAVGSRDQGGTLVPFSSERDLTVSGLVDEGLGYAKKGRDFDAEIRFRQALHLVPDSDSIKFNLAIVLGRQGQDGESLRLLKDLSLGKPESIDYLIALGQTEAGAERYSEALKNYKAAFQLARSARNANRAAAIARTISTTLFQMGNEQESLCYSYEAYNQKPSGDEAFSHGRMTMSLGLYSATNDFMDRAIETDKSLKSRAAVLYISALAKYALGDLEAAFTLLDRALDFVNKEQSLGAELSAAWYVMRMEKNSDLSDLGDKEMEDFEKIRDAAFEFGDSNPRAFSYWPPPLVAALTKAIEAAKAEE